MLRKLDAILEYITTLGGKAHPELTLFLRYSVSGGVSAMVDLAMVFVLTEYVRFHPLVSGACSTLITMILNFIIVKFWSFRSKGSFMQEFTKYAGVAIAGILLNYATYSTLIIFLQVQYLLARVAAILVAWAWNYTLNRKYSFRHIRFHGR